MKGFSVAPVLGLILCGIPVAAHAYPGPAPQVGIIDNGYSPGSLTVYIGDTVTWSNSGRRTHTATSDTGVWTSNSLGPGGTFAFAFSAPGTYAYHCTFHEEMHGSITVQAAAAPTSSPTPAPPPTLGPSATPTQVAAPAVLPSPTPVLGTPTPVRPSALAVAVLDPLVGGTLSTATGDVSVVFPSGAVSSSTDTSLVSVASASAASPPDGYRLGTTRFQLIATESFAQSATLIVRPTDSELADAGSDLSNLALARLSQASGAWELLETSVNDDGTLSAPIDQPGTFGVLEVIS